MSEKTSPDTVPGLGFKDKEKALETLKVLEGRDPDYQKLAIKGLIGRAKRTLTLTKAEDKLQNIKDAMDVFETWLQDYEKTNMAKDNRPYLPLSSIEIFTSMISKYKVQDQTAKEFLSAYKSVNGEYKHLRTVSSGDDKPTWDIVRNTHLKRIIKCAEGNCTNMWEKDLPTEYHLKLIMWAYSPDANKIKKNLSKMQETLNANDSSDENGQHTSKNTKGKRKSDSSKSSDDDTPKKKSKK